MSQTLYCYRPAEAGVEDDRFTHRWFETGQPALSITGPDGGQWTLRENAERDQKRPTKCIREKIVSIQLPRWWPYAKRHDAKGNCVFESETEVQEACRRARDAGEVVAWDY